MVQIERRMREGGVEVRAEGDVNQIIGHAAVFYDGTPETEFQLFPGLIERIDPKAFTGVNKMDVRALFNHDPNQVLGRAKAKTLALHVDDRGLAYTITPGETSVAADVVKHITRGDVTGSSFSFTVQADEWVRGKDGAPDVVTLKRVTLFDVGPVTFPAYAGTDTSIRAEGGAMVAVAVRHKAWRDGLDRQAERQRRLKKIELDILNPTF